MSAAKAGRLYRKAGCASRLPLRRGAEKRTESHRCKRFRWSGIQPLSHGVFILNRRAGSPYTGEPRNAPKAIGVNAFAGRGYNPSVTAFLFLIAVPAPLTQGSRERTESHRCKRFRWSPIQPLSQNLRFCQLPLHRGAEKRSESHRREPCTGGPRNAPKAIGVNAFPGRGYNPSVKTCGFASSPYTGEPRSLRKRCRRLRVRQTFCRKGKKATA